MAKRMSLSERRERDVRGTDVFFGGAPVETTTQEVTTSEDAPIENMAIEPAAPEVVPPKPKLSEDDKIASPIRSDSSSKSKAPIQPVSTPQVVETKVELSKVTLYIRPDQVIAIETIQLSQRQLTGSKPDKSVLVQEALDLLAQKYGLK